jgi:hypothetical protein
MNRTKMFFASVSILLFLYLAISGNAQAAIEACDLESIATLI